MVAGQFIGGIGGWVYPRVPYWMESVIFGAALSALPTFFVALAVQAHDQPGSLGRHAALACRTALIAACMTGFALAMPMLGFGED